MIPSADDFGAIAARCQELRRAEHGENALPLLSVSAGEDLDKWAALYELSRHYCEVDEALRKRIQVRI